MRGARREPCPYRDCCPAATLFRDVAQSATFTFMLNWCDKNSSATLGALSCPACGGSAPARRILVAPTPNGAEATLLACVVCNAHFFANVTVGNYGDVPLDGDAARAFNAALAFYVQQGAGLGGIAMRLTALGRPVGTRYLEIGCGFGFGLDFARRGLGWDVAGIDPSPFAEAGRAQLDLPIARRYFGGHEDLQADFDVIHASEFLEHVADPSAILDSVHASLRPGGTLLLTTPAAEMIRPDTSEGLLVPLLSIGWHTVIQSAASLTLLLHRSGFTNVHVERHGTQLVAHAGGKIPCGRVGRTSYREWLSLAVASAPPESDLMIGLQARLYREHAQTGDLLAADEAWTILDAAVSARYGRSLTSWCDPASAIQSNLSLASLAGLEPLCLPGLLLTRGWSRMQRGEPAEAFMAGAVRAADRLRGALRAIGSDDGDAEDVGFAAQRELIICAADRGEPGVAARVVAFERTAGPTRAEGLRRRCFLPLVNGGALEDARLLKNVIQGPWEAVGRMEVLGHEDASILFCAATLELQTPGGQVAEAITWLQALRRNLIHAFLAGQTLSTAVLFWPVVDAEALALRMWRTEQEAVELVEHVVMQVSQIADFPVRPAA